MVEPTSYRYDVFISYHPRDGEWVWDWLLPRLEQAGLRVCIDQNCFQPGAPVATEIEQAVSESRRTLAVMTPAWVESQWDQSISRDARVRSVLAPVSVVKPIEYPRRAADGSLWYPVISDAVPDAIGWVNSAGLAPTEATPATTFTQEILARYAAKRGCPKPPGPGPGCSADPNAGVAPCLQIDAQNVVTP